MKNNKYQNAYFEDENDIELVIDYVGVENENLELIIDEDIDLDEDDSFHYSVEQCLHNEIIPNN